MMFFIFCVAAVSVGASSAASLRSVEVEVLLKGNETEVKMTWCASAPIFLISIKDKDGKVVKAGTAKSKETYANDAVTCGTPGDSGYASTEDVQLAPNAQYTFTLTAADSNGTKLGESVEKTVTTYPAKVKRLEVECLNAPTQPSMRLRFCVTDSSNDFTVALKLAGLGAGQIKTFGTLIDTAKLNGCAELGGKAYENDIVNGVKKESEYSYRVTSQNSAGFGPHSDEVEQWSIRKPGPVTFLKAVEVKPAAATDANMNYTEVKFSFNEPTVGICEKSSRLADMRYEAKLCKYNETAVTATCVPMQEIAITDQVTNATFTGEFEQADKWGASVVVWVKGEGGMRSDEAKSDVYTFPKFNEPTVPSVNNQTKPNTNAATLPPTTAGDSAAFLPVQSLLFVATIQVSLFLGIYR